MAFGEPTRVPLAELSLGTYPPRPDLSLRLRALDVGGAAARPVDGSPRRLTIAGLPVCSGDVCQSAVSVPGFDPSYGSLRSARSDAFALLLARARVEPIAAVGRALVATGVRVDYSPPFFGAEGSGAHGWGNVGIRLRLRLDAANAVVVPAVAR